MNQNPFRFTVIDSFDIDRRGVIVAPFFSVDDFEFDRSERVTVQRPDGSMTETIADFDIPMVSPMPKVFETVCFLRTMKKEDVPVGSVITILDKSDEQIRKRRV
jgi:hypothetical protein